MPLTDAELTEIEGHWAAAYGSMEGESHWSSQAVARLLDEVRSHARGLCYVLWPGGPNGEQLACGFRRGHEGVHSWAWVPTPAPAPPPAPSVEDATVAALPLRAALERLCTAVEETDRFGHHPPDGFELVPEDRWTVIDEAAAAARAALAAAPVAEGQGTISGVITESHMEGEVRVIDGMRVTGVALAAAAPAPAAEGRCYYGCSLPPGHGGPHLMGAYPLQHTEDAQAGSGTFEPKWPPIEGMWSTDADITPEQMKGIGALLKEARAKGEEVVIREGITLTWHPIAQAGSGGLALRFRDALIAAYRNSTFAINEGTIRRIYDECAAAYAQEGEGG